jgi:hypothetical protein
MEGNLVEASKEGQLMMGYIPASIKNQKVWSWGFVDDSCLFTDSSV